MKRIGMLLAALLLLGVLPAVAGPNGIERGIDLWDTVDGSTKVDFRFDPIPAGFFCKGSEPFTGTIAFRGVPVTTEPAGILGGADTIVERLDHATFDQRGLAKTRIRVRALNFEGMEPIRTTCGTFVVTAGLHGEQPLTEMRILKEHATGGTYEAPISINVRLTFERQDGKGWPVHLDQEVRFPTLPDAEWAFGEAKKLTAWGELFVDTDSDGIADSLVPAPTSFVAGSNFVGKARLICHGGGTSHQHCIRLCDNCDIP